MKILISAYACEPASGSEPGVGWNWSVQAALHGHDVTTITRENNRSAIEAALAESPVPNLNFHFVDLPEPLTRLKKRLGWAGLYVYYYLWQLRVWSLARQLAAREQFDLVHHVTFGNDWMPSGAAGARAPLIWGPVGGSTHVTPRHLRSPIRTPARSYEAIRRGFQTVLRRFDPLLGLTRRRAALILTYTDEALAGIPARHRSKARPIVHIGVTESETPVSPDHRPPLPFTVLSGGRLVHWKGFDLLLEGFAAFASTADRSARLVFTGDGAFRPTLERLARERGIAEQTRFLGKLPTRDDVYRALAEAHLYALPTLRDGPPVAILEAMLAAKPILCLDHGATRELVPAGAGLKISLGTRAQIVTDIDAALSWARLHLDELHEMGLAARRHALTVHDWRRIGDEIDSLYRAVARVNSTAG